MKKFVTIILLGMLMVTLTACSAAFSCDMCGLEKKGKKHVSEELGVKITICNDCYQSINSLFGN